MTALLDTAKEPPKTLVPFVALFTIDGKRASLRKHFQLSPLYDLRRPRRMTLMVARQLGKTYGILMNCTMRPALLPNFPILFLQPRLPQVQRSRTSILRPLLNGMAFRGEFVEREEASRATSITFKTGSTLFMDYAFMSPDRLRGYTGVASLYFDEAQDFVYDFIPVIGECLSAQERYGFYTFSGTPKTTDGTLGAVWDSSSQCEWVTPCRACGKSNVPSVDQHLLRMIGKETVICAHCGKALNPADGSFVPAYPERMDSWPGYHIPQIVHPLHCLSRPKWSEILYKVGHYSKALLYNEVFGVPCDESVKLLTLNDLKGAMDTARPNTLEHAVSIRANYPMIILCADWSGGGELEESHTMLSALGARSGSDIIDVLYVERIRQGGVPEEEAGRAFHIMQALNCSFVCHDYTGAGDLRERFMIAAGIPPEKIIPFTYTAPCSGPVVSYKAPAGGTRSSYHIEKARSLSVLMHLVRTGRVRFPAFDLSDKKEPVMDLLALVEVPRELSSGRTLYLIAKAPKKSDDFAMALNLGCSALYIIKGGYPELMVPTKFTTQLAPGDEWG